MEQANNTEMKVGALVTLGLVLLIATIIMLGSGTTFFKPTYILKIQFDSVQGLNPGSVVQLMGVPIGNVSEVNMIELNGLLKIELNMIIDKKYQHRITEGSTVSVRTQGALGDKFIYINAGPPLNKAIPANEHIPPAPKGDMFETLAAQGDRIERVFDVLDEAHLLLTNLNAGGNSARFMQNLVSASDELNKLFKDMRGTGEESRLRTGMTHLSNVMQKIDTGKGTLGALVNDPSVFENLKRMLGGSSKDQYIKGLIRETIQSGEKN